MAGAVKRIVIADDHEAIRRGIREVVERADRVIVGEASDGLAAIDTLTEQRPDLAILDHSLPLLNGLQIIERAKQLLPDCRFLLFTMHDRHGVRAEAEKVGAHGLVLKSDSAESLKLAVDALLVGRTYFSTSLGRDPRHQYRKFSDANLPKITTREAEVLKLIAEGHTNRQTAALLSISVKTVETHRMSLQRKAGANNTADLVRFAIRNGYAEA